MPVGMRTLIAGLALCCGLLSGARAQAEARYRTFEVVPFVGLRTGGEFEVELTGEDLDVDDAASFALAFDLSRDESSAYELFYARQSTELEDGVPDGGDGLDVEYLHIGGTLVLDTDRRAAPYLVATLGATRFSPDAAGVDDETRFSFSLGGGLRVPLGRRFALRLEARGYLTLLDTDSAIFCRSDETGGLCRVRASGSSFLQYELLAGLALVL